MGDATARFGWESVGLRQVIHRSRREFCLLVRQGEFGRAEIDFHLLHAERSSGGQYGIGGVHVALGGIGERDVAGDANFVGMLIGTMLCRSFEHGAGFGKSSLVDENLSGRKGHAVVVGEELAVGVIHLQHFIPMLQAEFADGLEAEGFFIAGIDGNGVVGGFNTLLILLLLIGYIGHKEPRIEIIRVGIQDLFGQFSSMITGAPLHKDLSLEQ